MVQVTDDKGCVKVDSFLVNAPMDDLTVMGQPHVYPNGTPFSCEVCNDAIATLNINGGIPPYTIQWTGAGTAQGDSLVDIPADSIISYIVTDALGCVVADQGAIPRNPMAGQLEVMAEFSNFPGGYNVSGAGAMDGEIKLTIVGGQAPYTVQWMHGPTTEDIFGLSAGYYEVTVNDNVGNMVTEGYTLTSPQNGLSVMLSGNYSSCNGSGNISAMVNGGTPPYSYVWSGPQGELPGETWSSLMIYEPGMYSVQVTDANASNATSDITLSGGGGFTVQLSSPAIYGSANASCSGTDGSIVVTITGGEPPFNITVNGWSDHTENQPPVAPIHQFITTSDQVVTIDNLHAGGYDIFVSDMSTCGGMSEFIELASPPDLQVTTIAQELTGGGYFSCETCSDGVVDAAVLNGAGPFSYAWFDVPNGNANFRLEGASIFFNDAMMVLGDEDPQTMTPISTTQQLTGVGAESWYALVVTDQLGCMGTKAFTLEKPGEGAEPAWRLGGNTGLNNWLGTNDNTDLVLKANNQPQLRLGVDGITEFLSELKASSFQSPGLGLLYADSLGMIKKLTGNEFGFPYDTLIHVASDSLNQSLPSGVSPPIFTPKSNPLRGGGNDCGIDDPISKWIRLPYSGSEGTDIVRCELGNVGIGQYTQTWYGNSYLWFPLARLHLHSSSAGSGTIWSQRNLYLSREGSDTDYQVRISKNSNQNSLLIIGSVNNDHHFAIERTGNIGIGTTSPVSMLDVRGDAYVERLGVGTLASTYAVEVCGTIRSKEVIVEVNGWCDYVFAEDYDLRSIDSLREFIAENGHLPEVPSALEVEEGGIGLGEMNKVLLKKVEELTLYIIDLKAENDAIRAEFEQLKLETR
jgi:hypothetical protein